MLAWQELRQIHPRPKMSTKPALVFSFLLALAISTIVPAFAASVYPSRLADPQAVYLTAGSFAVHGDGVGDDTTALQLAIDRVQETTRQGIVFVPPGKYRLTRTVFIWSGIRLVGYGEQRPVFVLAPHNPGFGAGDNRALLRFAGDRPIPGQAIPDSDSSTCYSGLSNIDIEIGDGNPGAVAIRFHVGDQCILSHCDIHVGSGYAGIDEVGGEAEDLHIVGGQYGIVAGRPVVDRTFVLLDSSFESQGKAAIKTEENSLALVRVGFRDMPNAITVDETRAEELYVKDSRLTDISGAAITVSDEANPRTQINLDHLICAHVPLLVLFRESGTQVTGPGEIYGVRTLCHGLQVPDLGVEGTVRTTYDMAVLDSAPEPSSSDIPSLPDPGTWVNITSLGARGDGIADDTAVFKDAIQRYRAIYVPSGRYRITDTLVLQPDTVLIGLDPATTEFVLPDNAPAFAGEGWHDTPSTPQSLALSIRPRIQYQGIGGPKALIEAPMGGSDSVTGIGIDTGCNSRAVGIKWMAGPHSLLSDIVFLGGAGTFDPDGHPIPLYNMAADPNRRWDSQYESLWVAAGGGVLMNIWSANPLAKAGAVISDTSGQGHIYGMSLSGHVRNELQIRGASGWQIVGLATHEGCAEGERAMPVSIDDSVDLSFIGARIGRDPGMESSYPYAVNLHHAQSIQFLNMSVSCPGKLGFESAVFDQNSVQGVPELDMASLSISGQTPQPRSTLKSVVRASDSKPQRLAGGFRAIQGAAVDSLGNLYFVDPPTQSIYRWNPDASDLTLIRDDPTSPQSLAFDRAGDLLVIGGTGAIYVLDLGKSKDDDLAAISPVPSATRAGLAPILPLARYREDDDFLDSCASPAPIQYVSPDGSVFIPAAASFQDCGPGHEGDNSIDLMATYAVAAATPGKPFYVADEFDQKTYALSVTPDGSLANPKLFAERGEAGTTVDALGDVYIAAGRIYVYDPTGKEIDSIDVPERPTSIVFGGKDRQTLFICAGQSLYAMRMKVKGL